MYHVGVGTVVPPSLLKGQMIIVLSIHEALGETADGRRQQAGLIWWLKALHRLGSCVSGINRAHPK